MRALIIAGGGMRGAFASGACLALEEMGERFDAVYGTSAGGAMAAWFTAGQADDGTRTWRYADDRSVLSYRRFLLRRGPLIDLEHLYNHVYPNEVGLDVDKIRRSRHPALVTAADVLSGAGRLFDLRRTPVLPALHATSALPIVAGGPVEVEGRLYFDGGLTDPIPIAAALRDGATDIMLLLNRPGDQRVAESRPVTWAFGQRFPSLARHARNHHRLCMDAVRLANHPPDGVSTTVVRPDAPLPVGRFTRDVDLLRDTIRLGHDAVHRKFTA